MLIENAFTVAAGPGAVWAYLLDVERVAPCMPGAELTEAVDDRNWKGKVNVRFGPVTMAFAGSVAMQERDDEAHRVVLRAKGTEQKGKGAANAIVTSWLEPADDGGTHVKMQADITLTGAAAQLSRGLLPEISKKLTQQFADCLQAGMDGAPAGDDEAHLEPAQPPPPEGAPFPHPVAPHPAPKPVGGIGLGLSAVLSAIVGFIRRLFRR
jgi:uncharacterized protein